MPSLVELAEHRTELEPSAIQHLQRLVGSWALPCDLSFSDLLLYAPTNGQADEFVVLGHVRSSSGVSANSGDPVGKHVRRVDSPLLARCLLDGVRVEMPVTKQTGLSTPEHLLVEHVPIRLGGEVVAVLTREREATPGRVRSGLQAEYGALWSRFATMIEQGSFPFDVDMRGEFREPRVGDGVLVFDRERRVVFSSPNAVSALHRLGVAADIDDRRLDDVGADDSVLSRALSSRRSAVTELHHGEDISVVMRCYPLLDAGRATGAVAVLRDVSELRSRERLLLSKDTTIREIHHRVKNNLQTVQSLLRLQARRLVSDEAKGAVEQSARRIGSIAIVHETLASDTTDAVDFDDVAQRIARMVEVGFDDPQRRTRIKISGSAGVLSGDVAMPLAVALAELVQNAIDHSADHQDLNGDGTEVEIDFESNRREVRVRVCNHGRGLPEGFSLDRDAGLGLTIVRTFVVSDLGGTITFRSSRAAPPATTVVEIRVPVGDG